MGTDALGTLKSSTSVHGQDKPSRAVPQIQSKACGLDHTVVPIDRHGIRAAAVLASAVNDLRVPKFARDAGHGRDAPVRIWYDGQRGPWAEPT